MAWLVEVLLPVLNSCMQVQYPPLLCGCYNCMYRVSSIDCIPEPKGLALQIITITIDFAFGEPKECGIVLPLVKEIRNLTGTDKNSCEPVDNHHSSSFFYKHRGTSSLCHEIQMIMNYILST